MWFGRPPEYATPPPSASEMKIYAAGHDCTVRLFQYVSKRHLDLDKSLMLIRPLVTPLSTFTQCQSVVRSLGPSCSDISSCDIWGTTLKFNLMERVETIRLLAPYAD